MKTLLYTTLFFISSIFFVFISCSENGNLDDVNNISIDSAVHPKGMNEEQYMLYIVSTTKERFLAGLNITNDTIIFRAQEYFVKKNDPVNAGYASLYAGLVYLEKERYVEGWEYFIQGIRFAEQTGNNLLKAKCLHNAGIMFYHAGDKTRAIPYFHEALKYYEGEEDTERFELISLRFLTLSYYILKDYDNALLYWQKGFSLAKSQNNNQYIATFSHIGGLIYHSQRKFDLAEELYKDAIALTQDKEELFRINMTLSFLYVDLQRYDLAEPCISYLEENISEIVYPYTLENAYFVLYRYYSIKGDLRICLNYLELQKQALIDMIRMKEVNDKLWEKREKSIVEQNAKEVQILQKKNDWLTIAIIAILAVIIFVAVYVMWRMRRYFNTRMEDIKILRLYHQRRMARQLPAEAPYEEIFRGFIGIDNEMRLKERQLLGAKQETITYDNINNYLRWADEYLKQQGLNDNILSGMEEFDKIFLAFCADKYPDSKIARLLQMDEEDVYLRKLKMKGILEKYGLSEKDIKKVLCDENIFSI